MYNNKFRFALSIFWIVLGGVLMILSVLDIIDGTMFSGLGGGLIAVGALQVFRWTKYEKDADYREKVDVEIGDERNKYISMLSWSYTGYAAIIIAAIGSLIAFILKQDELSHYLTCTFAFMTIIRYITYFIATKKN
jgi:hypothetical protein